MLALRLVRLMRPELVVVGLLALIFPAVGAAPDAPLEIDILEGYLATGDEAPAMPHCARHSGYALVPGSGPVGLPTGGTNRILEEHFEFHLQVGDGPPTFAPSPGDEDRYGEIFLEWHEYFVGLYQRWRAEHGHPPLLGWNPATPMPSELAYPFPARACMDGRNDDPQVPFPTWATLEGGEEPDPIYGHMRLCDFADANQFGKSIAGGWHRAFHAGVGGEMNVLQGPRDPAFWAGHQFLIDVTDLWRAECGEGATNATAALATGPALERAVPAPAFAGLVVGLVVAACAARGHREGKGHGRRLS